jgi:protein-tyrosine phosphatase
LESADPGRGCGVSSDEIRRRIPHALEFIVPVPRFSILFVCTGNICRSALAERVLATRLADLGVDDVEVSSAGTSAIDGRGISRETARVAIAHGADPDGFRSSRIDERRLAAADLIIGMTEEHCARVSAIEPTAFSRVFTLAELTRVSADTGAMGPARGADHWRAFAAAAVDQRRRGLLRPLPEDDVADPYGKEAAAFDAMAARIVPAIDQLVGVPGVSR